MAAVLEGRGGEVRCSYEVVADLGKYALSSETRGDKTTHTIRARAEIINQFLSRHGRGFSLRLAVPGGSYLCWDDVEVTFREHGVTVVATGEERTE